MFVFRETHKTMIKKLFLLCLIFVTYTSTQAQSFNPTTEIGVQFGGSYYIGDLNDDHFSLTQPAMGIAYRKNLDRRFTLKGAVWAGEIRGNDKINNVDTAKINRNLHFKSPIYEVSGQIEFNFLEYETGNWRFPFSPFVFTGISFFHFNPQARRYDTQNPFDRDGEGTSNPWTELQPLGTEGQNIVPGKEPYMLSQFSIPLGVGFKLSLGENINMMLEYGIRKTFTDYLDDVSGTYVSPADLYGHDSDQTTVELSDQSLSLQDYVQNGGDIKTWDQNTGRNRGNENTWTDWYSFAGLTLSFKIIKTPKVCQY